MLKIDNILSISNKKIPTDLTTDDVSGYSKKGT
jgi:hypothetical protein